MKTTIELPDDLLILAKTRAAETRSTLRELVVRGLRHELGTSPPRPRARKPIRWVTVPGGLPPGLDLTDRENLQSWLRGGA